MYGKDGLLHLRVMRSEKSQPELVVWAVSVTQPRASPLSSGITKLPALGIMAPQVKMHQDEQRAEIQFGFMPYNRKMFGGMSCCRRETSADSPTLHCTVCPDPLTGCQHL